MMTSSFIKRIFCYIVFGVLLFSLLFLRSWHLFGPISWRNFSAILLFFIALIFAKKNIIKDTCIKCYILWLLIYLFVNAITGYITTEHIYKNLVGYHFVSLMLLFSLPRLIKEKEQLQIIVFLFGIFYLVNALVTIFQFFNNHLAWEIGNYISPMNIEKAERMESLAASSDNMLSYSICSGLNGFVVTNGQFIACFVPIVTFFALRAEFKYKLLSILVLSGVIFTSICVQQRMCFFVTLLYCVILLYYCTGSIKKIIPIAFMGIVLAGLLNVDSINLEDFGRLFDFTDNHRTHIKEYLSQFLSNTEYVLLGHCTVSDAVNNELFLTLGHNALLDSLRRGGILCFAIYIYLIIIIIVKCYHIIKEAIMNRNIITVGLGTIVILNLIYSFTHSDGIPSGSVFFWGTYALMMSSCYIDKQKNIIKNKRYAKPF